MKWIIKLKLLLLMAAVGALTSRCAEPKKFDPVNIELTGGMQATVNGVAWDSKLNTTFILDKTRSRIMIAGFEPAEEGSRRTITIEVERPETGAYIMPVARASYTDSKANDVWQSTSCNVEITRIDEKQQLASGTFTFTGKSLKDNSERVITAGKFTNIQLSVE